jgi:hypothetical protein
MSLLASVILVAGGLVLAFAGRRYVWLLLAASGFLLGWWLAGLVIRENLLAQLLLALAAGVAAGFLLRGLGRIVFWIAGFVLVGTAAVALGGLFGMEPWSPEWILTFLAGGVLGIVLARFVREIGVMIITALGGAAMVMIGLPDLALPLTAAVQELVGPVVAVAGFIVQYASRGR